MTELLPLIHELLPAPDPVTVFRQLANKPHCLFLDSALREPQLGRYSFITADPFQWIDASTQQKPVPVAAAQPLFSNLEAQLKQFSSSTVAGLPPFQGGAAGLFSYELGRGLEPRVPAHRSDEFAVPAMAVGFYDVVVAWDHATGRAWLISQGFPEIEPAARHSRAAARLQQFQEWLAAPLVERSNGESTWSQAERNIAAAQLAPQFPVPGPIGLTSNFSADAYRRAVQQAIDYIYAGDIFQVNIAQRLLFPARDDSMSLYLRLRDRNAATFAGYFDLGEFQIVSASPERFVKVQDRQIETRPIKGTRRRMGHAAADLFVGDELQQSAKDRAENVMIVDLLRNDLSRVCSPESVRVTQLCGREVYRFVQHLVSVVVGELAEGQTAVDLLRAAFPGGSITGAPKVRAMEIIAELENTARGPYCGSLGYLGFDGSLDLSILIRTITAGRGWWQMPVGGGIVAASQPQLEYEETWHKAAGLLRALEP